MRGAPAFDRMSLNAAPGLAGRCTTDRRHAAEAQRRIEEVVLRRGNDRSLEAVAAVFLAGLYGMEGRVDEARDAMDGGRRGLAEVGVHHWIRIAGLIDAQLALLAGDPTTSERLLREAIEMSSSADHWFRCLVDAELPRAVHAQGRHDEAFALAEAIAGAPPLVDIYVRTRCNGARALALGSMGCLDEAEKFARAAAELASGTDCLNAHGDSLVDLAEILGGAGRLTRPLAYSVRPWISTSVRATSSPLAGRKRSSRTSQPLPPSRTTHRRTASRVVRRGRNGFRAPKGRPAQAGLVEAVSRAWPAPRAAAPAGSCAWVRESAMPETMIMPPAHWRVRICSESNSSAQTAPKNGCKLR